MQNDSEMAFGLGRRNCQVLTDFAKGNFLSEIASSFFRSLFGWTWHSLTMSR